MRRKSKSATRAAKILTDKNSSKTQKEFAGSTLSQTNTNKKPSENIKAKAKGVIKSNKYNKTTKELAFDALSKNNK